MEASRLVAKLNLITAALKLRIASSVGDPPDELLAEYQRFAEAAVDVEDPWAPLGLSASESVLMWMLAAVALVPDARRVVDAATQGEGLTLRVLKELVYGCGVDRVAFDELSSAGALRRLAFMRARQAGRDGDAGEDTQRWEISPRVLRWLHGDREVDADLRCVVREPATTPALFVASDAVVAKAAAAATTKDGLVVCSGAPGLGRRLLLQRAAAAAGHAVLEVDAARLAKEPAALSRQLRAIARECRLLGRVPLIRNIDAAVADHDVSRLEQIAMELVPEVTGPVFVTCGINRPAMRWGRPTIVIEMKAPTSEQRARLWLSELGAGTQEDAEYLATLYPLAPALIHHAAKAARASATGRSIQPEDIYSGVRSVLDDKLGDFATRVEVTQSWEDLVLPQDQLDAIQYLIARIRQRRTVYEQWGFAAKVGKGLGTSALFSGPPGTGKTMVAALIARDLGLELYQVDMSKVVSKWIGETERNLAALFDAAEAGHAVLLFDEADALFGKRTDVKSSNDRYANLETNFLLQRLERFTGICLLTSNHESSIDPAFQRRLSLHVRFELPEADERAALWQAMLPAAAPVASDINFTALARRFVMSGGYIRNAALRAAFLAADESSVITAQHIERAAVAEYEAMGKIAA